MQHQVQPTGRDRDDDLLENGPQNPLAGLGRGGRMVPQARQVCRQSEHLAPLGFGQRRRLRFSGDAHLFFEPRHFAKLLIPASLKIAGHQAIVGARILPVCRAAS